MKTGNSKWSILFLALPLVLISGAINAQDNRFGNRNYFSNTSDTAVKKLTKEQKKELRKKEIESNYVMLDSMITSHRFVLEASYLQGSAGLRTIVNPTINFVGVFMNKVTLQVGNNTGTGYNGLGGITTEGESTRWDMTRNPKNKTITLRFDVNSAMGHYDLLLRATAGGYAEINITGITPGTLTWIGEIKPIEKARVFKGHSIY
ncbi:MAG TPA: DUF4251 domain-containing protein [Bacteroidales bacterium]|nr:DUF4251 domain-containing protein [Bacteroidales bacterium]